MNQMKTKSHVKRYKLINVVNRENGYSTGRKNEVGHTIRGRRRKRSGEGSKERRREGSAINPTAQLSVSHVTQSFFPGQN